ncbi:MAG: hypothetical protein Q9167_006854, partial [Letrouitia subvulpina]
MPIPEGFVRPGNLPSIPRLVIYHHTHRNPSYRTLLTLLTERTRVSHIVLSTFSFSPINHNDSIFLNDRPYADACHDTLWSEVPILKEAGVKVMGLLRPSGYAQQNQAHNDPFSAGGLAGFQNAYQALLRIIREKKLDGLDIDVEGMNANRAVRLIRNLKLELGREFLVSVSAGPESFMMAAGVSSGGGGAAADANAAEGEGREAEKATAMGMKDEIDDAVDFYIVRFY